AQTYVEWLEALIGHDAPDPDEDEPPGVPEYTLNLPDAIRRIPDARFTPLMERDLAALSEFKALLRGLLSAASLFSALKLHGGYTSDVFLRDVRIAVEGAAYQRGKVRDGRVLITSVSDARGLPHDHVFIPGMAEGVFPAPTPEDPLLLDSERARLQANGVELPTQAERADDEGLFYELIGLARESLTLSRPCYKNGEVWAESHLYRAVRAVFPAVKPEQVRIGAVIAPDDVATRGEACVTAISGAPGLRAWLAWAHGDFWARVELGRRIELGRLSRQPHDRYTGRLADETLVGQIGAWLSPHHRWSATQLGEYGVCGFKFFTRRLLRLEALETPEEGMDARQLGVLQHEILEKTYGQIGAEGLTITPPNAERARAIMDEIAADVLRTAPRNLRFRPSALWSEEQAILLRRLRLLIEMDFSGDSPLAKVFSGERTPYRQEARFPDGATLDLGGERLRLTGIIDRIDRSGDRAVIIDYKSGGTEIPTTEIEEGRNFQMLVYLAAAESLLDGLTPEAGVFWHLSNRKTSGVLTPDDPVIEQGKDHLRRMLESARRGQFDAHANGMDEGKCARVCDYAQFCRVAMTAQNKGAADGV
ncbi:MAG: PD-(D/E)XK nuclease family protein, partial [Anaerolinea sp.]|nr:PD-(D/E)XK nuclease family protein [Anaerolinea sp.]